MRNLLLGWLLIFACGNGAALWLTQGSVDKTPYQEAINTLSLQIEATAESPGAQALLEAAKVWDQDMAHAIAQFNPDVSLPISKRLESLQESGKAALIYVLNDEGTVYGSSTYAKGKNIVGNNYHFRPYFSEAIKGKPYRYAALGVTTRKRGLYYSCPIYDDSKAIRGVATVKMDLGDIDKVLNSYTTPLAIVNAQGFVFSSNFRDWLYRRIEVEGDTVAKTVRDKRQVDVGYSPSMFSVNTDRLSPFTLSGRDYLGISIPVKLDSEPNNWHLVMVKADPRQDHLKVILAVNAIGIVLIFTSIWLAGKRQDRQDRFNA